MPNRKTKLKTRVLLLEDEAPMAKLLNTCLRNWGYEVIWSKNVQEAWQALEAAEIDVLITDWHLPGRSGTELAAQIRDTVEYKTLPILMISGRAGTEDVLEAARAGVNAFLPKPFTLEDFRQEIELVCNLPDHQAHTLSGF
jgi:two-component system, chemotaxis family, chemotaxis protein CheY